MRKQILTGAFIMLMLSVSLTACGQKSEKQRIQEATIEMGCEVAKPSLDAMKKMLEDPMNPENMEKAQNMETEMMAKMEDIAKRHGFENSEAIEKAAEKYKDDADFEKATKDAIKKKCDFDIDAFEEELSAAPTAVDMPDDIDLGDLNLDDLDVDDDEDLDVDDDDEDLDVDEEGDIE